MNRLESWNYTARYAWWSSVTITRTLENRTRISTRVVINKCKYDTDVMGAQRFSSSNYYRINSSNPKQLPKGKVHNRRCRHHGHEKNREKEKERLPVLVPQELVIYEGFVFTYDGKGGESGSRHFVRYKWSNTMLGYQATELSDAWFEVSNITYNVALWFMKHAAKIAGKDEVFENEAKEVHSCLRKAAGIFSFVQRERARINEESEAGSDLDPRVVNAYVNQCTAEAQEVTVVRTIELKHKASLISALANETSKLFEEADQSLAQLDPSEFEKWQKYLQLKSRFYLAYAYSNCGVGLLGQDQCGTAIGALKQSEQCLSKSEQLYIEYGKARGAGTNAKPESHLKLKPVVKRTLEKWERENGFIYHQKVSDQPPELELKATYGLVKPEEYDIPSSCAQKLGISWSPQIYAAFDITEAPMPDFSKSKSHDEFPVV